MKEIDNNFKKGNFKELYDKYINNKEFHNNFNNLKEGYYRQEDACGECLKCIGAVVCLDTLCGCFGGRFCI